METITIKIPTREEVKFEIIISPEDMPVRGNAIDSGDLHFDEQVINDIFSELDKGNLWAWCCVKVLATWKMLSASEYLGGCSYENEQDFINNSGHYQKMKNNAYEELVNQIKKLSE